MYNVNVPRVRGKMAERNYTITSLAAELGIDRNTLSKYLDRPHKIPYDILSRMASLLCFSEQEAQDIFFAEELTQYERMEGA